MIIGDEVLGGKVCEPLIRHRAPRTGSIEHPANEWWSDRRYKLGKTTTAHGAACSAEHPRQAYLAKFCFQLGIGLKRIEVIADDESEIIEAVRRMSKNYDFVVTSGGIGPT